MEAKYSREKTVYNVRERLGDNLNYSLDYIVEDGYVHRYLQIGTRYYKYDEVGNITAEREGPFAEDDTDAEYYKVDSYGNDIYGVNEAWNYFTDSEEKKDALKAEKVYHREFTWDEKNQLINSKDNNTEVSFVYGEDGKRTNKYTDITETLYFNSFWTYYIDGSTKTRGGAVSKHIFLGEMRLAAVINDYRNVEDRTFGTEKNHIYFYHSDHLGSAQLVTDHNGDEYQRLEYTPYGETWVDIKKVAVEQAPMNFMFSAKELDKETGFYYYGARYLDSKYSMWLSTDPALGEYIPQAPINDEIRKNNQNLPGMGGIFNHINNNLYHYAGNNPVKYTDPDGKITAIVMANIEFYKTETEEIKLWVAIGCPTNYNPKMKAVYKDIQKYENNIEIAAKDHFVKNLSMKISPAEQEKYINDEKRIYAKILLVRSKGENFIKTTNSLIEEARIEAERKYQSLGNNKELTRAEKIKISEDYANEQLEKKLDSLLENIK